jgi:hypothetical protein
VIKLIVKLAIVALVANAAWHVMAAYMSYYKFQDAVQQTTQFGNDKSIDQLRTRVLALASDYDVPVGEDDLSIKRDAQHTIVESSYSKMIDLLPGYAQSWTFQVHTDTFSEAPMAPSR